jgi:endonuclease/exonuclease/phosphatase (EEP) superfamily protein YafD
MIAEDIAAHPAASKAGAPQHSPPPRKSLWRRALAAAIVVYALAIVALWAWMHFEGDRSWAATLFLFGPRWVCALPLALLVPAAAVWHRRMLWLLAVTGLVILVPILGFQVHVGGAGEPYVLRVLTCNVGQRRFHPEKLARLVEHEQPDIVVLQEVPFRPPLMAWPQGWHVVHRDELLVASRHPIVEREQLPMPYLPGKLAAIRYTIELPGRQVDLVNLHLMSPRRGLEAVLDRRTGIDLARVPELERNLRLRADEARLVSDWIAQFPGAKIVAGDFNTPVESTIFRRDWSWLGDAFSSAGFGFGFTKITEKEGWSYGARIDHVLYGSPWRCVRAWVGPDIGSDHLPLVADFQ